MYSKDAIPNNHRYVIHRQTHRLLRKSSQKELMIKSGEIRRVSSGSESDDIIDSDDSWDEQTMQEVAADIDEELERERRRQQLGFLDKSRVTHILQETIETTSKKWWELKHPKCEKNAYSTWIRLQKGGDNSGQRAHCRAQALQEKLQKLVNGIEEQVWKNEGEVRLQAKSLEQTVENQCRAL